MRQSWRCILVCLGAMLGAAAAHAQPTADPLRLVPADVDLVLQVERPRELVEKLLNLEAVKAVQELQAAREFYDSTNFRRFLQFLSYFEKELGAERMTLLDRAAGGGIVLAVKFAKDPTPALLIIQGKDAKTVEQLGKFFIQAVEQEQDGKAKLTKEKYRDVPVYAVGTEVYFAIAGSTAIIANRPKALRAALDLHTGKDTKSIRDVKEFRASQLLLGKEAQARLWLNLDTYNKSPEAQTMYATIIDNPVLGMTVGGIFDTARRSSSLSAGLLQQGRDWTLAVRLPRGLDGMAEHVRIFFPQGKSDSLPLLEPKNAVYSLSYYMDIAKLWTERQTAMSEKSRKELEKFDEQSAAFLAGTRFSQILTKAGPYQRIVGVEQASTVYTRKPKTKIQPFALVQQMRDPDFGKSMEVILRGAALLGNFQFGLKLVEEKHGDVTLISYRFPEKREQKEDPDGIRFNFSPCFATVGDQLIVSSTVELGRELVTLVQQEKRTQTVPHAWRSVAYSKGFAAALRATEEVLVTQAVLGQALTPQEAREQVQAAISIVEGLGTLTLDTTYNRSDFRLDLVLKLNK